MYKRKEHVTLDKLLPVLKESDLFDGQHTALRELLKEMGFNYKIKALKVQNPCPQCSSCIAII